MDPEIKNLLRLTIQQVDALTTQITELMPLKNLTLAGRAEERTIAVKLTTGMNTLRQLAKTILDS